MINKNTGVQADLTEEEKQKAEEAGQAQKKKGKKPKNTNVRNRQRHLKMIELGDKTIMIDSKIAAKENNRAEKQCQDNNLAYYYYKRKDLFPSKMGVSVTDKERGRNKVIVSSFKSMQESVKLRNLRYKNKQ